MDGLHDNSGRISFTVNGEAREVNCAPSMRLSEVLREALALRATKVGCNAGDCGACTVLLDGLNRWPGRIGRCPRFRRRSCAMVRRNAGSAPRA